jgi:PPOX class probable FMN-dependent enzyme
MTTFNHVITSLDDLRAVIPAPPAGARAVLKDRPGLDAHARAFIHLSPLVVLATADADGRCDVSPKGDAPGFVQVLDDHRLVVPDRPGNRRIDNMLNILSNPHVGLLFLVPGRDDTLRVNGRASITRDPAILARCAAQGKTPVLAIGVDVEQCYFHCAKAFLRSRLWQPDAWPAPDTLPSYACMLFDQIRPAGATVDDYEREIADANATRLY